MTNDCLSLIVQFVGLHAIYCVINILRGMLIFSSLYVVIVLCSVLALNTYEGAHFAVFV